MRASITLVVPPGAGVERPSLGLEMLQAAAQARGHRATLYYANLRFAEAIGLDPYLTLLAPHPAAGVMDWVFSRAAFPGQEKSAAAFHAVLQHRYPKVAVQLTCEALAAACDAADAFVEASVREILIEPPTAIGCTSMFGQHSAALALLRRAKALRPEITSILGGANCDGVMGVTTHRLFSWIDYVVVGEGEVVLPHLLQHVEDGARSTDPLPAGVLAPCHRSMGYPAGKDARAIVEDLSEAPHPVFDDFLHQLASTAFADRVAPGLLIETSRGCWWGERSHCRFCGLNGAAMQYRRKAPEQVIEEIDVIVTRHGIKRIEAVDNILAPDHIETVFGALAKLGRDLRLFYEVKPNLGREDLAVMAAAGVRWIQPGIESLATQTLRLMGKGAAAWQNIVFLRRCRQLGIRAEWNLIFGTPGETEDALVEQARLLPLLEHLEPGLPVSLQYCRFSPYHDHASDYGLRLVPVSTFCAVYPLPREEIADLVYFFEDESGSGEADTPVLRLTFSAIAAWRSAWSAPELPLCCRVAKGEDVFVVDTRAIAADSLYGLNAAENAVLDAAEPGIAKPRVLSRLAATGLDEQVVEAAIANLITRHLLLEVDRRLVSLVLDAPVLPLPAIEEFPGGHVAERAKAHWV